MMTALALIASLVPVILAIPVLTAETNPSVSTAATLVLSLLQTTVRPERTCPLESFSVTINR